MVKGFHLGTKKQHSAESPRLSERNQFNYCDECKGWFLPLPVSGAKGPPDKPGLEDTIAAFKKNFSAGTWEQAFFETVRVNLNYNYTEQE